MARWPSGLRRTVQVYLDLLNLLSRFPCLARGVGSNPTLVNSLFAILLPFDRSFICISSEGIVQGASVFSLLQA